jgi:hypothetical protein
MALTREDFSKLQKRIYDDEFVAYQLLPLIDEIVCKFFQGMDFWDALLFSLRKGPNELGTFYENAILLSDCVQRKFDVFKYDQCLVGPVV